MDTPQVKKCTKCGATWFDGQLFWATGAHGSEADLAGLVCDSLQGEETVINEINDLRENHTGQESTWERWKRIDQLDLEMRQKMIREKELEVGYKGVRVKEVAFLLDRNRWINIFTS